MKNPISNNQKSELIGAAGLVGFAVISRWIPHLSNFSPLLGLALFSGARFQSRSLAFLVPLASLFLSDFLLGWHETFIFVYAGLAFLVALGSFSLKSSKSIWLRMGVDSSIGALGFFILTNFGVWVTQDMYVHNGEGLWACLVAGLPFFPATWISSVLYSYLFFIMAAVLGRRFQSSSPAQV